MVVGGGGGWQTNKPFMGGIWFFFWSNMSSILYRFICTLTHKKHHNLNTIPSNNLGLAFRVDILGDS